MFLASKNQELEKERYFFIGRILLSIVSNFRGRTTTWIYLNTSAEIISSKPWNLDSDDQFWNTR